MKRRYKCLVINYSIGMTHPVCFVKELRFDGNDEKGLPVFSEEYWEVSKGSLYFGDGKFRKYNDDNFIVVGIMPDRFDTPVKNDRSCSNTYFQRLCNFEPIVFDEF